MSRRFSFVLSFLFLFSFSVSISAQKQSPSASKQPPVKADKEKSIEEQKLEAEKRATAVLLLLDVAEESAKFNDLVLRARVQSRAANTLWDTDQDRARSLFRKAWDSAVIADKESTRRFYQEARTAIKERGSFSGSPPPHVSQEVLRLAARRDRALGEELLAKLENAKKEEADAAENELDQSPFEDSKDPFTLTPLQKQRISLANSLLETDVEKAVQFADPALVKISMEGLSFLCSLREKNAALADQRYSFLLSLSVADTSSDPNAISFLSSYIFTPFEFVRYGQEGSVSSNNYGRGSSTPFNNDELRLNFLRVAEQVLTRTVQPQDQARATTGNWGRAKTIERLLPHFERYTSAETVATLRAHAAALRVGTKQPQQQPDEDGFMRQNTSAKEDDDFFERAIQRAQKAQTTEERDNIYADAAINAVHRNHPRAIELVEKIEDNDLRGRVRSFVDFHLISHALRNLEDQKKKTEAKPNTAKQQPKEKPNEKNKPLTIDEMLKLIRNGSITNFQRVWALLEVTRSIIKTDKEKASDLLEEATSEARRIETKSIERPQAFIGIAVLLHEIDNSKGWDFIGEVIRAANAADNFKGEDGRLNVQIQTNQMSSRTSSTIENFDIPSLFRKLANDDLNRAISQGRSFTGEYPRSTAIITIAQTILAKKEKK